MASNEELQKGILVVKAMTLLMLSFQTKVVWEYSMITMATGVVVLTTGTFQTSLKSFDFPLSNIPYHNLKQQKNQN